MYDAEQEGQRLKKSKMFVSTSPTSGLDVRCDHSHDHLQLRGAGPAGSRTAAAARYPKALCDAILASISAIGATSQDGGRRMHSNKLDAAVESNRMPKLDQVVCRLRDLGAVAREMGHDNLFQQLVEPWINQASQPAASTAAGSPQPTAECLPQCGRL